MNRPVNSIDSVRRSDRMSPLVFVFIALFVSK